MRNVVCLSAVLMSLGQVAAIARVVRVNVLRGEIEVQGLPSRSDVESALAVASQMLEDVDDLVGGGCLAPHRASEAITVTAMTA
jgi:hypothetical protein